MDELPIIVDTVPIIHSYEEEHESKESEINEQSFAYMNEYITEARLLILKTNIMNLILLIEEYETVGKEASNTTKKTIDLLKNTIILHGKEIRQIPGLIDSINTALFHIGYKSYHVFVIYKMLANIRDRKFHKNINFRCVNENVRKYPPIPVEDRIYIEKKIKYMKSSYQVTKTHDPFKVDQIVGARDKEHKWWLSRILHVYDDPTKSGYWYYVRFEGWGQMHDEWIYSGSYRVRWYNPRKHFLKK